MKAISVLLAAVLMAIVAGCVTAPHETTDDEIVYDVQNRLADDSITQNLNIGVTAHNGVVTLQGTVVHDAVRKRAIAIALSVQGVEEVKDAFLPLDTER